MGGNAQIKAMKSKKVAGGLRLILAAFRELEAFAQLGTELDKETQAQLDSGYRMVELLKQPQYQPLHVADQVISIFAGSQGFFSEVPVNKVAEAEEQLLQFIHDERSEVRDKIIETGNLDDELEAELVEALNEFVSRYTKQTEAVATA